MPGSNSRPLAPARESPTEPFKRAVIGCMRAIAGNHDLEVTFAADRPQLSGTKARLPEPPRKMTAGDVAVTRGLGDSLALRLACHDAALHRRTAPSGKNARAVFDAVEQARVEALGAQRMSGVANNLAAMLEDRYHRGNYHEITDRADAPLEDAVALLVRERLTGKPAPASASKLVELWRPWIEERADADLDRLARSVEDQSRFADAVRELLSALEMGDEAASEGGDDSEEGEESEPEDADGASDAAEGAEASSSDEVEAAADESDAGEGEAAEADADEIAEDTELTDARETG